MKTCFKCGDRKPLSDFYRHKMMADGRLGKCKDCTKRDVSLHRQRNIESIREYDRQRSSQPHRIELRRRVSEAWRKTYPERNRAHQRARRAVKRGIIAKPESCGRCSSPIARLQMHHPDYSQPLLVEWLCKPCHAVADRERREAEKVNPCLR